MRSHLLEGEVRHRRARPFVYALEHDVYYLALDLDELDDVDRSRASSAGIGATCWSCATATTGCRRPGPAGGVPRPPAAGGRRPDGLADHLRDHPAGPRLRVQPGQLLPLPDGAGTLRVVVVEVHNTHGERHLYTLRPSGGGRTCVARWTKEFYVSPFIEMEARYTVRVHDDAARLRIAINTSARRPRSCTPAWTRPASSDRPDAPADAAAASARDPEDDAADPLARAAPVASRRTVPPTSEVAR